MTTYSLIVTLSFQGEPQHIVWEPKKTSMKVEGLKMREIKLMERTLIFCLDRKKFEGNGSVG